MGNQLLNTTAFFAARALSALEQTEAEIKKELLHIVTREWKNPHPVGGAESTINSGWTSGLAEPLTIVQPPSLPWRNSSEQVTVEKSPTIIDRLIYQASSTGLVAKPKMGKTTLMLDAVEAIIFGTPFLKEEVMAGSVLYVSEQPLGSFVAELFNSGLLVSAPTQLQLASNEKPMRRERKGEFHFVTIEDWYKLTWSQIVEATVEHAVRIGACLVVFDTLSRIARVKDENSASEMQAAVDELTPLIQKRISTLVIQHERKSGGTIEDAGRGTNALTGAVDVILRLNRPEGNHPGSYRQLEFIGRFPGPSEPRVLERKTADSTSRYELLGNVAAVKGMTASQKILDLFQEEDDTFTEADMVNETEQKRSTVKRAINKLVDAGLLSVSGDGKHGNPLRYSQVKAPF